MYTTANAASSHVQSCLKTVFLPHQTYFTRRTGMQVVSTFTKEQCKCQLLYLYIYENIFYINKRQVSRSLGFVKNINSLFFQQQHL